MKHIYFDNAATTPMRPEVIAAITSVMNDTFGNPSSTHHFGRLAKVLVEKSRNTIASLLKVSPAEIIFTSGGTEANNLILKSAVSTLKVTQIITSKIEHQSVLQTIQDIDKQQNITVSYVDIDTNGKIDLVHLETMLKTEQISLVSLMHINNEIGNISNIEKVAEICKRHDTYFHTDAVQSIGHYPLDLSITPIDFLSASAHKFYGPKGIGFAFVRKNTSISPLIIGGEQERGIRAGTENVPLIVGMETAIKMAYQNLETEKKYILELKEYFILALKKHIPEIEFNGFSEIIEKSSYTIINVRFPIIENPNNMMLFQMDLKGIACSKGSACQSGSLQKSHVLSTFLSDVDIKKESLRFSLSIYNTKAEIDYVVSTLSTFCKLEV